MLSFFCYHFSSCFCFLGCCCYCLCLCCFCFGFISLHLLSFAFAPASVQYKVSLLHLLKGGCYTTYSSSVSAASAMRENDRLLLIIGPNSVSTLTFWIYSRSCKASFRNSSEALLVSDSFGVSILCILLCVVVEKKEERKKKKCKHENAFFLLPPSLGDLDL